MKKTVLFGLLLASLSGVAQAATTIDVAFLVTQKAMEGKTQEAVFNQLQSDIDTANDMFNAGIDGLNVNFRVAAIEVIDGVNAESDACTPMRKASGDIIATLHKDGLLNVSTSFGDSMNDDGHSVECYTETEQATITKLHQETGADTWVLVDGLTNVSEAAIAGAPIGMYVHLSQDRYHMIAHEFGHLLGLADLYTSAEGKESCQNGAYAGRLMCSGYSSYTDKTKLFSEEEKTIVKTLLNSNSCYDWGTWGTDAECVNNFTLIPLFTVMGTGAAINQEIPTTGTVSLVALDDNNAEVVGDSVTVSKVAQFKVRLSEAADHPVYVQLYSNGTHATVGTDYNDLTQQLVFAAGETEKLVTATVTQGSSNKSFVVNIGSAVGTAIAADADLKTVTIKGTGGSDNGGGDNGGSGSSGGGSMGGIGLALLAGMGWMRRKAQQPK